MRLSRWYTSVFAKVLVPVLLLALLISGLGATLLVLRTRAYAEEVLERRARIVAIGATQLADLAWERDDLQNRLRAMSGANLVDGMVFLDAQGQVWADGRPSAEREPIPPLAVGATHLASSDQAYHRISLESRANPGRSVVVVLDLAPGRAKLFRIQATLVLSIMSVAITSLLVLWLLIRRYVKGPIDGILDTLRSRGQNRSTLSRHPKDELGLVASSLDRLLRITERNRLHIAHNEQHLLRNNQDLRDFTHIISHDLRQPIGSISRCASWILQDGSATVPEAEQKKLQRIVDLALWTDSLLTSLLEYTRIGQGEPISEPTDLVPILNRVALSVRAMCDDKELELSLPEQLPLVLCHGSLIGEVFSNLLLNAAKYCEEPVAKVVVSGECLESENCLRISVSDNGIGIPEKFHSTVFTIFKRLHGTDKYAGGTGSGLTISSKIVGNAGGRMWIESKPDGGSIFFFTLPLAEVTTKNRHELSLRTPQDA